MISFPSAIALSRAQVLQSALDSGSELRMYAGTRPAAGGAPTGSLLLTFPLDDPRLTITDSRIITFAIATPTVQAPVAGFVSWGRLVDSAAAPVMDGSAGLTDSGEDFELTALQLRPGAFVTITQAVIVEP